VNVVLAWGHYLYLALLAATVSACVWAARRMD
jgi:hypothetical protein